MDWLAWHRRYDESPTLQARLALVRTQLSDALTTTSAPTLRLISLCAGDGRDVIGTLSTHPRLADTAAYLVELNPALVAHGQATLTEAQLSGQIHFITADATTSNPYLEIAPADILLVCGVFGNVRTEELPAMIDRLRCLCRRSSRIIWTRRDAGADGERAVSVIQEAFASSGFREIHRATTAPAGFVVGTHQLDSEPLALRADQELFRFIDYTTLHTS